MLILELSFYGLEIPNDAYATQNLTGSSTLKTHSRILPAIWLILKIMRRQLWA